MAIMRVSVPKIVFFALSILLFAGTALADVQIRVSTISNSELNDRQSTLKQLSRQANLSAANKELLSELMREAEDIATMNDRCGSISLTEVMDNSCQDFYNEAVPRFEAKYFKVTGEVRLNAANLSNANDKKRMMIDNCYDAIPIRAFHPSRWVTIDGVAVPEPLETGMEVEYSFTVSGYNSNQKEMVLELMRDWYSTCQEFIYRNNNQNEFAPLFESKFKNEDNILSEGGVFIRLLKNHHLQIKSDKGVEAVYSLNGKEIFSYAVLPNEVIFDVDFENDNISSYLENKSWEGKIYIADDRQGLNGQMNWGKVRKSTIKAIQNAREKEEEMEREREREEQREYERQRKEEERLRKQEEKERRQREREYEREERERESAEKRARGEGVFPYFQGLASVGVGAPISFRDDDHGCRSCDYYSEYMDSTTNIMVYALGLANLDFYGVFSIGVGAGFGYFNAFTTIPGGYYSDDETVDLFSFASLVLGGEAAFHMPGLDFGAKVLYFTSSEYETTMIGGFAELANLLGIGMGWQGTKDYANSFYLEFYLRFPPHGNFLKKLKK